jgi:ammonia channel protein AmtB
MPATCRTSLFFYEGNHLLIGAVRPWFFSWTFAIAACTITSGSLAERTALLAYPAITTVIVGVLHPLVVHWLWAPGGWMGSAFRCPVLDFAGGLSVHVLGGMCGLLGAWRCGPRLGRFEPVFTAVNGGIMHADEGGQEQDRARAVAGANSASAAAIWSADPAREVELGAAHQPAEAAPRGHSLLSVTLRSKLTSCSRRHARVSCTAWLSAPHVASAGPLAGHDMALVTLGTFMLFFGWYGFNTGSVYMYLTAQPDGTAVATADLVQRTSMNTALGGAAGGLVALLFVAVCSGARRWFWGAAHGVMCIDVSR